MEGEVQTCLPYLRQALFREPKDLIEMTKMHPDSWPREFETSEKRQQHGILKLTIKGATQRAIRITNHFHSTPSFVKRFSVILIVVYEA